MPRHRPPALVALAVAVGAVLGAWSAVGAGCPDSPEAAAATAPAAPGAPPPAVPGPARRFDCALDLTTDAFTGADASASAIGWEGNHRGVVTCLGGTFLLQERNFADEGFGLYDGAATTWTDVDGYLPAQVTAFRHGGADVHITEFADRDVLDGDAYVAVYCRVAVENRTGHPVLADPLPSPDLVALDDAPDTVPAHGSVVHDYVVAADRFGNSYPWPSAAALRDDGGYDAHFAHMRAFWEGQLATIAQVQTPEAALDDAYRAGFIETQIARSGDDLDTGVNGYETEYSHDVVGILTNLFTQGFFADGPALLLEARDVVAAPGQYVDGLWTYTVPWAVYLMKTGDVGLARANFATDGPLGPAQPSIEEAAHQIAADRTGPDGTMAATDDIDTQGQWTVDDEEALLGLAAYRYVAERVGDSAEAAWATGQYDGLLAATDQVLGSTIEDDGLRYLPCSLVQPDTANRCDNPEDANWASPLGAWAWEAPLLGATATGPLVSLIGPTYSFGFGRLEGRLPFGTFGGYPGDYYSSTYNAAYGTAGLAGGPADRSLGIVGYEFMIEHSQSGPYSWWESSSAPAVRSSWVGQHPTSGQGASPHAWGLAGADKVLLDSLVAQAVDGDLVVGRGVPDAWWDRGPIGVGNFPALDGRRIGVRMVSAGSSVTLSLTGPPPPGRILFELPAFVGNVASASRGSVDERDGVVSVPGRTRRVTVTLRHVPATSL